MKWHGDEFLARVRRRLAGNLAEAGRVLADRMRETVAEPGPPASTPGSPPHDRTDAMAQSITSEVDAENLTVRVGSPTAVAGYLEHGTHTMPARPFARPALANSLDELRDIVTAGIGKPEA